MYYTYITISHVYFPEKYKSIIVIHTQYNPSGYLWGIVGDCVYFVPDITRWKYKEKIRISVYIFDYDKKCSDSGVKNGVFHTHFVLHYSVLH
jgi:hypothetical protein